MKMKFKRLFALVLALCIVGVCALPLGVLADDGTITISDGTADGSTVAGRTFAIYQIFEATTSTSGQSTIISYQWYTYNDQGTEVNPYYDFFYGASGVVEANKTDGDIQSVVNYISGLSPDGLTQMATALYNYIQANSNTYTFPVTNTTAATGTSITIDNLDYGYYLIYDTTSSLGTGEVTAAIMLTSAAPTAQVTLKAESPTVVKEITAIDGVS